MMPEVTDRFRTWDGLNLFYRYFAAPGENKPLLLIIHGHGEHSGRYVKFADHLERSGFSFVVMDSRGNGQSEGKEVYVNSLSDYIQDVDSLVRHLRSKEILKEDKFVLFGHSLGGLVSVYWALKNKEELMGLILSSPCLGLNLPLPVIYFNRMLNTLIPGFTYGSPIYPPHLSHDPKEVELYKRDPYIKRKISVRLLDQMISRSGKLMKLHEYHFPFPVHILMAEQEKVVNPEMTRKFYARVKAPSKNLVEFKGFYHEIFNEEGQGQAFEALNQSLSEILKT